VELFLNGQSLGKQTMKPNSKLSWQVKYAPGTLSAKGYDDAGSVIAETKVETTGEPAAVQLTPDRATINADGEDVSVITVSVTDAQGRIVPVAGNKISFALEGAGKILGVGNGNPSCHEPDTYIAQTSVKSIPVNDWRWKAVSYDAKTLASAKTAEYAAGFDDSDWDKASSEGESSQLSENQLAIFRQHVNLSAAELESPDIQIEFGRIDDNGWIFVNGQRAGESRDWQDSPAYDIKNFLHEGDNVIAVGVQNIASGGGLGLGVSVQIAGHPVASAWSRSVFNGLAQVIVQSTKDAGEIKLSASGDGLKPTTVTVTAQPAMPRPSVP
jgi:beta-galactosidase